MNTNYENTKTYGYTRVSTKQQSTDRAEKEIADFCYKHNLDCTMIYVDKGFDRPQYQILKLEILKKGDKLIITRANRLGRDEQSVSKELKYFQEKEISVIILELLPFTDYVSG